MKIKYLAAILPFSLTGLFTGIDSVNAQTTKFVCGSWRDIPTTVAQTSQGNVPIIFWVSDWVNDPSSNLTPQNRCETVSQNFQQAYDRGELKYITTGKKNDQDIVCVAKSDGGVCESQLFTLKPGSNPTESLKQLMNISNNYASGDGKPPLVQSTGDDSSPRPIYIEFDDFLQQAANAANNAAE